MSTIIQSKKTLLTVVVGAAIALVLAFGSFTASAQALTQDQIDSILGMLEAFGADEATMDNVEAALKGEAPTTPAPADPTVELFDRDLNVGSTGNDVKGLQQWLNDNGYTVAASGAGSPGNETDYFGELTRQALAAYQAANGIEPVAGYFGPITRSAVNAEIEATRVDDDDDGTTDDDDDATDDDDDTTGDDADDDDDQVGYEGTIEGEARSDYRNVEVAMNQTKKVATFRIEAEDSDVNVQRIDLYVENDAAGSTNDSLMEFRSDVDHLALYVGDDKVAETAINRNTVGRDDTYIRFGGLNIDVAKGGYTDFTLEVTASGEETPLSVDYEIGPLAAVSIRGVDTAGINIYTEDTITGVHFDLTGEEQGELEAKSNTDSPDEQIVPVTAGEFEEVHLLSFDIEVGDSDIDLEELTVSITDTVTGAGGIVQDIILKDGSSELGVEANDATVEFTDLDLELYAGETLTLDVYADVKIADVDKQGGALIASLVATTNKIVAYDMADNPIDLEGDVTGKAQAFYVVTPSATLVSANIVRSGDSYEYGEATLVLDVTAVGGDLYFTEEGMRITSTAGTSTWDDTLTLSSDFNSSAYTDLDDLYTSQTDYTNGSTGGSENGTDVVYELKENETGRVTINAETLNADDWVKLEIDEIVWWALNSDGDAYEFSFDNTMDDIDELETDEVRVRTTF